MRQGSLCKLKRDSRSPTTPPSPWHHLKRNLKASREVLRHHPPRPHRSHHHNSFSFPTRTPVPNTKTLNKQFKKSLTCSSAGRRLPAGHVLSIHVCRVHQSLYPGHVPITTGLQQFRRARSLLGPQPRARSPRPQWCCGANSGRLKGSPPSSIRGRMERGGRSRGRRGRR